MKAPFEMSLCPGQEKEAEWWVYWQYKERTNGRVCCWSLRYVKDLEVLIQKSSEWAIPIYPQYSPQRFCLQIPTKTQTCLRQLSKVISIAWPLTGLVHMLHWRIWSHNIDYKGCIAYKYSVLDLCMTRSKIEFRRREMIFSWSSNLPHFNQQINLHWMTSSSQCNWTRPLHSDG